MKMVIKHLFEFLILIAETSRDNFEFTVDGGKKAITNIFVILWLLFVGWLIYTGW